MMGNPYSLTLDHIRLACGQRTSIWLTNSGYRLSEQGAGAKLHHRDVVGIALKRLEADLKSDRAAEVSEDLRRELEFRKWSAALTKTTHDDPVEP
jgi:hypothetical protein